jgi:hypothetical protein
MYLNNYEMKLCFTFPAGLQKKFLDQICAHQICTILATINTYMDLMR